MAEFRVLRQCCRSLATSLFCQLLFLLPWVMPLFGQSQTAPASSADVPHFVRFSGTARDAQGKPLSGTVGVTFALYQEEQGGSPLWLETQNVKADVNGHYTVYLGASKSGGLPQDVFVSGEARWLGVQPEGQAEQPRTLLLSVPYALKAGDAATIGGLPPSAFVLAAPTSSAGSPTSTDSLTPVPSPVVVGAGTADFVPLWTNVNALGNSVLFQAGSGSSAMVGINTTTPAATLDVNGGVTSRGNLQLPSTGTATASQGYTSQPFSLQGSAFNNSTQKAIGPLFQWQTEPTGNNTSNPAGTLNLLYGNGSGSPSETGLNIASNGQITFASGQTFPGTGTITGVTAGAGLMGGGTSGNVTLGLTNSCASGQVLQWNGSTWVCTTISGGGTITGVTAGTDLTGGGTSGNVTLNLDTAKVPQLNTANTFTGNQTVNGNLTSSSLTASSATFNSNNSTTALQVTQSGTGSGIFASATGANVAAIYGASSNAAGFGVQGVNTSSSGGTAVYGSTNSTSGVAVLGIAGAGTGNSVGVQAQAGSANGIGLLAINSANGGLAAKFSGPVSVIGDLATSGAVSGGSVTGGSVSATSAYNLGGAQFGIGSFTNANAFLGFAGSSLITGNNNTATGANALALNTSGSGNTAAGAYALFANTTAGNNVAMGNQALSSNSTGGSNTAAGSFTLTANTTGSFNTAVGYDAENGNATVSNGTFLGAFANAGADGLTNATAIGAFAQAAASNTLVLGSIKGVNGATADTSVGIGTTTPAAKLDVHGTANFTGLITFAPGQTFPGAGTITGVTAGTDLTGGGSSSNVTLNVDATKVVTGVVAGTDLTGGGNGGVQTLNLDTTKVPQLNTANTFAGNQTVNGNLTATGVVSGSSYQIGSDLFAFGYRNVGNAFLGFAGNTTSTGSGNMASGFAALTNNTSGSQNTAGGNYALFGNNTGGGNTAFGYQALMGNLSGGSNTASGENAMAGNQGGSFNSAFGYSALKANLSGSHNTAVGDLALFSSTGSSNTGVGTNAGIPTNGFNTTGSGNTFIGANSTPGTQLNLNNATAIGAFAEVDESNALVLGSINGVNGASADTLVGIGTTAPASTLDVEATAPAAVGPVFLLKNKAPIQSGTFGNSVDFRFALDGGSSVGNPNAYLRFAEDGNSQYGAWISFATMADGGSGSGALERMRITSNGLVGINTAAPDATLSVNGSADKPGGGSWGTFSDRRLKDLDGNFQAGLGEILKLQPVRYRYKEDNALGIHDREEHVGFVAQEVQKVIPEAVSQNSQGYLLVNNDPILWTMLNAIKEQQQQIREQREQIRAQQQQIARLSGKVEVLESSLRNVHLHLQKKLAMRGSASKPRVSAVIPAQSAGQAGN